MSAFVFAVLAGASAATWTICLKLASARISAVLGAIVITGVALLVDAAALLAMTAKGHATVMSKEGFWLLVLAGVAAAGVDVFALLAYERGLRVTSAVIIVATSTALVLLVGFLALHEPLTAGRVLAIVLIAAGVLLLQAQGG